MSTDRLFKYIWARFKARQATIPGPAGGAQVQIPRLSGERSQDRTLATLPDSAVRAVSFKINLTPQQVWSIATLLLTGDRINVLIPGPQIPAISQGVITIPLKPRIYTLTVQAGPQWNPGDGPRQFELYDDQEIQVSLMPAAMAAAAPPGTRGVHLPESPVAMTPPVSATPPPVPVTATIEAAPAMPEWAPDTGSRGNLIVTSQDRLAAIELLNEDRVPVMYGDRPCRGNGTLKVDDLPTGVYLVRLRIPEGASAESLVRVEAGKTATIAMQPPESPAQGLVRRVIDQVGFGVRVGNLVELSERIGSVAAPSISTVLELRGARRNISRSGRAPGRGSATSWNPRSSRHPTPRHREVPRGRASRSWSPSS